MQSALLRLPQVISLTGSTKSTLYKYVSDGLFPKPVKIGERCSAWPKHEIEALNKARIAGQTTDQIKSLVKMLIAQRTGAT